MVESVNLTSGYFTMFILILSTTLIFIYQVFATLWLSICSGFGGIRTLPPVEISPVSFLLFSNFLLKTQPGFQFTVKKHFV